MNIVFCGDIVPTEATAAAFESGDCATLMGGALDILKSADLAVGNLECALTDSEDRIRKCGPNLKGRPVCARTLADCGFTHLGLSNNHMLDFGEQGLRDTVTAISENGMMPFGWGENDQDSRKPLFITHDGVTVCVIAVCEHEYSYALKDKPGANPFDPFDTMEDIQEAKKHADRLIVMYHGGKELCEYPSERLRKACRAMVRAGADVVLTQHSHCIGCRETYRGGQIVYGQGNFNFVKDVDPMWHTGLMIKAEIADDVKLTYIPVRTMPAGIELCEGDDKAAVLGGFEARSELIKDEAKWMEEWVRFCEDDARAYYRTAASKAFVDVPEGEVCRQSFPHYLDCEAHLDVWKTIYKTWRHE